MGGAEAGRRCLGRGDGTGDMSIVDLLLRLRALGVTLTLDGERLKVSGPSGVITEELRAELAPRKAELIAFLREAAPSAPSVIPRAPQDGPLSFTQQRFWFFQNLVPDTSAYHVCFGLRLQGALDRAVLQRAIDEIVRRHELLRTVFAAPDGQPKQSVLDAGPVPVPLTDLSSLTEAEKTQQFDALSKETARRPFDLTTEPPFRAALFALAAADHALVVAMHHIASDAWSVTAFLRELAALYDGFAAGGGSPLPDLPVQYRDFAAWQRDQMSRPELDAQREYWTTKLAAAPTLQLPTDRPRPAFQTFTGGRATFAIPKRLADALDGVARQERATLFMALLAGFYALLQRYSGQSDLVVGTAIAGRSRPELEPLIGPFINTLALRTDVSGDPTFRTLVARARETALEAYAHQDLPFEKIVDDLKLDRALNRNPLFQVMLALQNVPAAPFELRDLRLSAFDIDRSTTVSDLEIIFWPTAAGLEGYVRYSADLLDASTVDRMLRHFEVLLEAAAAQPDCRLSDLPLLTLAEQEALASWNRTATPYPSDVPVHESFQRQAALTPDAPAIVWGSDTLSYRELDARTNALARTLQATGLRADDRVAVVLDRSAHFIVAAVGIMKAGGAYLPIETTCPADRLGYMLRDAGVRLAITEPSLEARIRECGAEPLTMAAVGAAAETGAPRVVVKAGNLAYVIYTSGSTGRPKGVALSHRGLQALVAWHNRVYGVTGVDRAALVAGLGFDASVWELWPYLLAGACVHVPADETRGSAAQLLEWLSASGVTICFAPTPLAEAMFDTPMPERLALRSLLTGGDKLHHVPAGLPFTVYNNYGPTESTVVTSWTEIAGGTTQTPSIGRPLDNTRVHVLDARLTPVPVGVPGELFVTGDSLARGYLDRPDLTADRFIPDPFAIEPGGRMYRTGDLVRRSASGALEFLGRLDDQVKVRGFRIELGEIEAVLAQHDTVREAVVVTREGRAGNRRLVAYVIAQGGGGSPTPADLTRYLKDRLPDYMVPSAIVMLDAFPLTPNGKVDRAALPDPGVALDAAREGDEPSTEVERQLAAIWARVLRLDRVGLHDNFFEIGGDSILALQVVAAARQVDLKLTPRQIFEQPTISELAGVTGVTVAATTDDAPEGDVPLTPIQRWFFAQDVPRPEHFNQAALLSARRRLDTATLERALRALTSHHDALRLRFERDGHRWRQFYAPAGPLDLTVETIDLTALPDEARTAAIEAEATRVQASLDLAAGPLVRAALFEMGADRPQRLLLAVHHLVIDTVSWRILVEDLEIAYGQLTRGETPALAAKTSSFKQWAAAVHQYAGTADVRRQAEYWRETLADITALPVDFTDGPNHAGSTDTVTLALTEDETTALLRDPAKAYGLQPNEVLIAAVAQSLSSWTGQWRVAMSLESYGRESLNETLDLSRSVGWFTALYPLAIDLAGADEPGELLKRVKEQVRNVPGLGIGFGALRYLDGADSLDGAQPSVSFNYLGQFDDAGPDGLFAIAPESTGAVCDGAMPRAHVLDVSARVVNGVLRLSFIFSRNLHRPGTIESLAHATTDALRELIAHCLAPDAGGYTPSDFPEANASQHDLDRLFASLGQGGRNDA
jgi:amino acid adenylation domain-containing protein/non-ribosomal peptide synthase protein (TIGR01720 family)